MSLWFERETEQYGDIIQNCVEARMKEEKTVRYEKPELLSYGFFGVVKGDGDEGETQQGGDIPEGCDSTFDA